jgi:hypothetical protein
MRVDILNSRGATVKRVCLSVLLLVTGQLVCAGEADVLSADINCNSDSVCNFSVTVRHDDEGWDHFANSWEILDPDGNVIAIRELAHPHVNEQPFTRSLGNVKIPGKLTELVIRAHDSVHGYGGRELVVKLQK